MVGLCLCLAACSTGATPIPTRLVQPPTLVIITPTVIGGVQSGAPAPAPAATATQGGPFLTPPSRPAPPLGVPTQAPGANPPTATPARPAPAATIAPPTPTPDPNAPQARRLTPNGCCPQPHWLATGDGVVYYGQNGGQNGNWAVPRGGGTASLVTPLYGNFSPDGRLIAYPDGDTAHVAHLDGTIVASWQTRGRVYLSPQTGLAAWLVAAGDVQAASVSLDPPVRVAIGTVASGAVATLPPAFSTERLQWFPDGRRILIAGREGNGSNPGLWVLDAATGQATRIASGRGLEQALISPDGRAVAYTATLQESSAANGVWLIGADGSSPRRAPITGGYRWSPDSASLYYVPLTLDRPTDELWRYRLADGNRTPIVGATQLAIQIIQDEWELAPTGDAIAYRSASDGAIWVVTWVR